MVGVAAIGLSGAFEAQWESYPGHGGLTLHLKLPPERVGGVVGIVGMVVGMVGIAARAVWTLVHKPVAFSAMRTILLGFCVLWCSTIFSPMHIHTGSEVCRGRAGMALVFPFPPLRAELSTFAREWVAKWSRLPHIGILRSLEFYQYGALHNFQVSPSPPWRQPRGKSTVSLVDSHTNATFPRYHLRELDLIFATGLPPGWTLNPQPSTLNPQPSTLTLYPKP